MQPSSARGDLWKWGPRRRNQGHPRGGRAPIQHHLKSELRGTWCEEGGGRARPERPVCRPRTPSRAWTETPRALRRSQPCRHLGLGLAASTLTPVSHSAWTVLTEPRGTARPYPDAPMRCPAIAAVQGHRLPSPPQPTAETLKNSGSVCFSHSENYLRPQNKRCLLRLSLDGNCPFSHHTKATVTESFVKSRPTRGFCEMSSLGLPRCPSPGGATLRAGS